MLDDTAVNDIYYPGGFMEQKLIRISFTKLMIVCVGFCFAGGCGGPPTPLELLGSPDETGLVVVDCHVRIVGNKSSGFSLSDLLASIFLPEKKIEAKVDLAYLGILDDTASVYESDKHSGYLLFSGVPPGAYYLEKVFASYDFDEEDGEETTSYPSELEVNFDPDSILVSVEPGALVYIGRMTIDIDRPSGPIEYESYNLADSIVKHSHDGGAKHEKKAWKKILKVAKEYPLWSASIRARLDELE